MAFFDSLLQLSTAQAITTTAASTVVYDVFGYGSGTVVPQVTGTTTPGVDIGMGDGVAKPALLCSVTTTFTVGTSLQVSIQAAPDNGSGSAGTYVTLASTQVFLTAALVKGLTFSLDIPPVPSNAIPPRFYRVNYTVVGTFSTGNINAEILLNPPSLAQATIYPSNFSAA